MSMSVLDIDSIALRHCSMSWENVMMMVWVVDVGGFPFRRSAGLL